MDKAVEVFNSARRSGLYLDEKIYTNMIIHYGKAGMCLIETIIHNLPHILMLFNIDWF